MALARLQMNVGKTGKAAPHAAYICRMGKYENRLKNAERLLKTEAGNMPKWAEENPLKFWEAADEFERSNGTTYREMEIALPRELNERQLVDLVKRWVVQELGEKHAYQWAIHIPKAADGGEQPHVHLMFSERQIDGIDRDPQQYFKRYNSKAPEKGGARKGFGENAGKTLSKAERIEDLKKLRMRWQKTCNDYLHWHTDSKARIDMRSYAERGLDTVAEPKQLPSQWRGQGKQAILELRAAKACVKAEFPHLEEATTRLKGFAGLIEKAEREYQHEADGDYWQQVKREELEKAKIRYVLAQEEVAAGSLPVFGAGKEEVERRFQSVKPLLDAEAAAKAQAKQAAAAALAAEVEATQEAARQQAQLTAQATVDAWNKGVNHKVETRHRQLSLLQERLERAISTLKRERNDLLEAHQARQPKAPHFLIELFKPNAYGKALQAWEAQQETLQASGQARQHDLSQRLKRISKPLSAVKDLYDVVRDGLHILSSDLVSKAIGQMSREHPELRERIEAAAFHVSEAQRKAAERQAQAEAARQAARSAIRKFEGFACEHNGDHMGYTAERWARLPEAVRELVDEYNRHRSGSVGRQMVIERLVQQPELRKTVETALDGAQRQAQSRGRGR